MSGLQKILYPFLYCALLMHFSILDAQFTNARFKRLTINDGLSLSSVYCIYQDSKGFMWFGTEDGLNKYDGEKFTVYRATPDNPNSPSHIWIELIFEDGDGNLWFGSRGGLTRFDPVHEIFKQYKNNQQEPWRISNDTITSIKQISKEILLAGTFSGLNQINLITGECIPVVFPDIPDNATINCIEKISDETYVIASDKGVFQVNNATGNIGSILLENEPNVTFLLKSRDRVWIGTDNGIYYYMFQEYDNYSGSLTASKIISTSGIYTEQILFDNASNMWLSSRDGLYMLDSTDNIQLIVPNRRSTHSLALIPGKNIQADINNTIWYTTHGDGIYRIHANSGDIFNFVNNPCDQESLSENAINCVYKDLSGAIWLGTFGAGISVYNPSSQKFTLLRNDPTTNNTMASNFVWSVFEDLKGDIWIGTNDKGISVYSPQHNKYSHYDNEPGNPRSLSHSSVRKIYEDAEGTIWVGTDGGGLNKFNRITETFSHYVFDPTNPYSISDNSVRVIYEDKSGDMWVGTRNGLNRFDRELERFERYLHAPDDEYSISNNFVYSVIFQDSHDDIWLGTYGGGLNKFNTSTKHFDHFMHDPDNPNSISDDLVFSVVEAKNGVLWIGTNSGLNSYNPSTGQFNRFGLEQGLPNEVIYGIVQDDNEHIWLSTNYGICRFNLNDYSTLNFDFTQGLQSNEFNGGAFHRGYSGKIYFGGVYGLNIIDPDVIGVYQDHAKMVLSGMEILGNEVKVMPGADFNNKKNKVFKDSLNYYVQEHISYANEIVLDYSIRHFSLEFVDLGNINTTNTQYAYFMEGLDNSWHNSGNRNFVSYANMQPGKYRFKVRSQQPDGSLNSSVAEIGIIITPPFWRSPWFIIIEFLLTIAIVYTIYAYSVKLKTYRILEKQNIIINKAYKKLARSEQNLKLMNATKDKFFSIVSHDLKNPFSSLLSISETINKNYDSFEEEEKKNSMQRISSSVKTIYNLLENLLTWSRTQTGRIDYSPEKFNITRLLKENFSLYEHVAIKKEIKLVSKIGNDLEVFADRNMINSVVRNLLNNALKFTPAGKSVTIGTNERSNALEVFIQDEGVGISEEKRQKLFRIDEKVKTNGTAGEKGTGLGLIICKEFIEKNRGHIIVHSTPGQGSTFRFLLPK